MSDKITKFHDLLNIPAEIVNLTFLHKECLIFHQIAEKEYLLQILTQNQVKQFTKRGRKDTKMI